MQNNETIRRAGASALAATGALHLVLAPEYLGETAYVGALFIAGGIASLALAAWIWTHGDRRALGVGALIAAGMGVGFILSRTTGLPGFHEGEWEPSGLLSLMLEAVVIAAAIRFSRRGWAAPSVAQAR